MKRTPLYRRTALKRTPFIVRRRKPLATDAELAHLAFVRSQPCIAHRNLGVTQHGTTEVHHIREGRGMGQKASHFDVIPLCFGCHSPFSKCSIHSRRQEWQASHGTERELLEQFKKEHGIER